MIVNLLFRLCTAHLLTDFVFQPQSWVIERNEKKIKSIKLVWHVLITSIIVYAFSGLYHNWYIPLIILITHYAIDLIKSYLPDKFAWFLADQAAHLGVIVILWLIIDDQFYVLVKLISGLLDNKQFWELTFSYVLVTWPMGIMIGKATNRWREEIGQSEEKTDSLANAGKWIGICERVLILTFVLTNQFTAIGFLIGAKSILRFGDKERNAQKKTEYILVGTLMSFAASALLGIILNFLIK